MGRYVKKSKRIVAFLMSVAFGVSGLPVSAEAASISSSYVLGVGKKLSITMPAAITSVQSKDKKIVKAIKKKKKILSITGAKAGTTTVTVKYGKKSKKLTIKVGATSISKKTFYTKLTEGDKKTVSVKATSGAGDSMVWTSSDEAIVSVGKENTKVSSVCGTSNTLTAHNPGTATITVRSKYTKRKMTCKVQVQKKDTASNVLTPQPADTQSPTADTPKDTAHISATPSFVAQTTPETIHTSATPTVVAQTTPVPDTATCGSIQISANVYGASVSVYKKDILQYSVSMTQEENRTEFSDVPNGEYTIVVEKPGYESYSCDVAVNGAVAVTNVNLNKQKNMYIQAAHTTDLNRVQVDFSDGMDSVDKDDFQIEGIKIYSANLTADKTSVILSTEEMRKDRSYTLSVKGIADSSVSFTAQKVTCGIRLSMEDGRTDLQADGKDSVRVYATVYDENGYVFKDLAGAELTYSCAAGNWEQETISCADTTFCNTFVSEKTDHRTDCLLSVTVTKSANKAISGISVSRNIVLVPTDDFLYEGAYVNDVVAESYDRIILYFDKEVQATDYTQNNKALQDIYGYDSDKLEILVQSNGKGDTQTDIKDGSLGNRNVIGLSNVEGNPKALCAYLDLSGNALPLTSGGRLVVKVTDKTKNKEVTSTKYTTVQEVTKPYITKVENVSLRKVRVHFSETVQSQTNAFYGNAADMVEKWEIDGIPLSDNRYGYSSAPASIKVGEWDKNTGEDFRNVVTITLGKNSKDSQIYFTAGRHSISCRNIGGWGNISSAFMDICDSDGMDFTVTDMETPLSATVEVDSPEQFYVTFDRNVDVKMVQEKLFLQKYTDGHWAASNDNSFVITPILEEEDDTDACEFLVEAKNDWTVALKTKDTYQNYYSAKYRLHLNAGEIRNAENGTFNKEINLPLDSSKITEPDTESPYIVDIKQHDELIYVTMSEPVQIPGLTEDTPFESEKINGITKPTITFLSKDNRQTISGNFVSMLDNRDTTFSIAPSAKLSAGQWKLSIASISDDVGNLSVTLTKDLTLDNPIMADGSFLVEWVLAIPKGSKNPLTGTINDTDAIYIKYNQRFKTFGNSTSAMYAGNYTLNGKGIPTSCIIYSSLDNYNETANIKNNYTDLAVIKLNNGGLESTDNTMTISSTVENIYGERLVNGGQFSLKQRKAENDTEETSHYYYAYNYETAGPAATITIPKLLKFLDDVTYVTVQADYFTDSTTRETAAATNLYLQRAGTFDFTSNYDSAGKCNTFRELHIATTETGVIRVKNAVFDKIIIDAPNAKVIFEHVQTDNLLVNDVLDGGLSLKSGSVCEEMNISDYRNGCGVEVCDQSSSVVVANINTAGTVTLGLSEDTSVVVSKPAELTFLKPVASLTIMPAVSGVKLINQQNLAAPIIKGTVTDYTCSYDAMMVIDHVNTAFADFEACMNRDGQKSFTVTLPSTVKMSISPQQGVTSLIQNGNIVSYTGTNQEIYEITVTMTATQNDTSYTATKTYRVTGNAEDFAFYTPS